MLNHHFFFFLFRFLYALRTINKGRRMKRIVDDSQCYVLFNVDLWLYDLVPMLNIDKTNTSKKRERQREICAPFSPFIFYSSLNISSNHLRLATSFIYNHKISIFTFKFFLFLFSEQLMYICI